MQDLGDKYSLLKGSIRSAFAKQMVAVAQKKLLSVAALVDSGHEVALKKDESCVLQPGTGRWQHIRTVRGTYETDFALELFATEPIISG